MPDRNAKLADVYPSLVLELAKSYGTREASSMLRLFDDWHRRQPAPVSLEPLVDRLRSGEPIQFVLNEAWFYGRDFKLNNNVLIPRPETEELVHWVIAELEDRQEVSVIDLGTGSGCIAVTLDLEVPEATVTATDISVDAINTASDNARRHRANVRFLQMDMLVPGAEHSSYDIIVCNPPYIANSERNEMAAHVVDYEPSIALFAGDDPLMFYKALVQHRFSLRANGAIFAELHPDYAIEVQGLFHDAGFASELKKDLSGRLRMLCAKLQ